MTDLSPGPGRRDALLIATGTYDDSGLKGLRSPDQDCAGLVEVLADPLIGNFRTDQVKDAQAHEVMQAVERFFRNRSRGDLLLLHVSCHGIKDDDGYLHFAMRDTDRSLLASTAMSAAFLRERMERCRARSIVVLLDCCYSGAFLPGAKGDDVVQVQDELGGHGRVVLTATSRTEYAWEGERLESQVPQPSRFTGSLIEGLRTGAADGNGDGRITVTELYEYVYESLHRAGVRQRPRMWADLDYQITLAKTAGLCPSTEEGRALSADPGPSALMPSPAVGKPSPVPLADDSESSGSSGRPRVKNPRLRHRRGQDVVIPLELDLAEIARGTSKDLRVETMTRCSACSGNGATLDQAEQIEQECTVCRGNGEVASGKYLRQCKECNGHGTVLVVQCPSCAGEGRVRSQRSLTVRIPAGIEQGSKIKLASEGEAGYGGGPQGDLFVEVRQRPHPMFKRHGDDLHCTVRISRTLAKTGGVLPVETLDGVKSIRIPGGIRSGRVIRLPDRGVRSRSGSGSGDLLVRVKVARWSFHERGTVAEGQP